MLSVYNIYVYKDVYLKKGIETLCDCVMVSSKQGVTTSLKRTALNFIFLLR